MKQLMISLGRETGSGGHKIAEALAQRFSLPLYDKNILTEIAESRDLDENLLRKYEETSKNRLLSRRIRGLSNSAQDGLAGMQFAFLRDKAESGASFVVVGRCAEYALQAYPGLISLFISGDLDARLAYLQSLYQFSESEAMDYLRKHDKNRSSYHNEYSPAKWGEADTYDLLINSSRLGIDGTIDFLEQYIRARIAKAEEA